MLSALLLVCLFASACVLGPVPPALSAAGGGGSGSVSAAAPESGTASTAGSSSLPPPPMQEFQTIEWDESALQRLAVSPLRFTGVLGVRKRFENDLPVVTGFQYPYVFYERMSALTEGAAEDDPPMYVGRYALDTREVQEFPIDDFNAITDEARLVIDGGRSVYLYYAPEQGMKILLFDFDRGTQQLLGCYPVYNVFAYAKKLSENELVFFLYESAGEGTQQIVLHCSLQDGRIREIYRGAVMDYSSPRESTRDIWAIDTENGSIHLLMQQLENGAMTFYLRTIDRQGALVSETRLEDLAAYDSAEDTADSLVVKGDYVLVHFSQFNRESGSRQAPSAILQRAGESYRLVPAAAVRMGTLCGPKAPDSPFLFFANQEDPQSLYLLDTAAQKGYVFSFGLAGMENAVADPEGNLLITARAGNESNWYLLTADQVAAALSQLFQQ